MVTPISPVATNTPNQRQEGVTSIESVLPPATGVKILVNSQALKIGGGQQSSLKITSEGQQSRSSRGRGHCEGAFSALPNK